MSETPKSTINDRGLECPHCGYVDEDSYEMSPLAESGETQCGSCDEPIVWTRDICITYRGFAKSEAGRKNLEGGV